MTLCLSQETNLAKCYMEFHKVPSIYVLIFRISKVFSQPGIAELMRNAESGLERGARGQGMPR